MDNTSQISNLKGLFSSGHMFSRIGSRMTQLNVLSLYLDYQDMERDHG